MNGEPHSTAWRISGGQVRLRARSATLLVVELTVIEPAVLEIISGCEAVFGAAAARLTISTTLVRAERQPAIARREPARPCIEEHRAQLPARSWAEATAYVGRN
jgi:hypothetical protein